MGSGRGGKNNLVTMLERVRDCDGFSLDAASGLVGSVEETWLDDEGHPVALAVRTATGRRGLLLAADIAFVNEDEREVTVLPSARLLELGSPRLDRDGGSGPAASWRTTGVEVPLVPGREPLAVPAAVLRPASRLLAGIALLLGIQLGLAFLVAFLVTGHAY
ncbi:MAG TPA: hypothetical protein VJ986_07255 [Gaiellaceae bacterium]|nr:hypothetical protein [Gaiellaceae bacterium]